MNTKHQVLRAAALAGAVVLFTGYVYQRAGGQLLETLGVVQARSPETVPAEALPPGTVSTDGTMFVGSKSAAVVSPQQPGGSNLLPGSKYFIIANPPTSEVPVETQSFPGSKSEILVDPVPAQQAAQPAAQSARVQSAPSSSRSDERLQNPPQQQSRP